MNDPAKLSAEFQELIVTPLEIYDGERGMVILLKVRHKVEALIKKHNKLVVLSERKCKNQNKRQAENADIAEKAISVSTADALSVKPAINVRSNNPADVIDLLIQMRYTCNCVAPAVVWLETLTYRHHWCKDCNRPYLEKED